MGTKKKALVLKCKFENRCHGDGLARNGTEVCDMCTQYIHGWNDCVQFLKKQIKNFSIVENSDSYEEWVKEKK